MSTPAPTTPRPSVIQLAIKEKAALYAAYIPLFSDGGVFIPDHPRLQAGRRRLRAAVAAGRSAALSGGRQGRLGHAGRAPPPTAPRASACVFPADDKSKLLKVKIEEILGGHLASERPTQTI
jgi:type IV pilus assembly protein PilZ